MAKRSDKPFDESHYQASAGPELMAKLQEARRQIRLLEAQELGLIAELDQQNIGLLAGYPSLRALVVDVLRVAPARATKMVNRATAVAETVTPTGHTTPAPLPTVRAALHDGLIDGEHLDAVADIMKELPADTDQPTRDLVEKTLGETARTANPATVAKHGKTLLQHLDQDGKQPSDAEPEFTNSFTGQRTRDGSLKFKGHVDAETGDVLEKLFDKLAKPQKLSERLPDPRSLRERQGDAFADLVHRVANPDGLGRTQISLTVDYDVLTRLVGTATLDSGCLLNPGAARRMCCDAGILPIVMKGPSVPLDVGRRRRLVTPEQRKSLIARDKGCAYPGCHNPARWTDAHHLQHWADGGRTDLDNLVLLCRRHHRTIHTGAWKVRIHKGLPEFIPPKWIDPQQLPVRNTIHLRP